MTPAQAKRANEQIRRLRAGLIEARDTLRDHFGPDDASVRAAEEALAGDTAPTCGCSSKWNGSILMVSICGDCVMKIGEELQPYQRDILEAMERQHRRNESAKLGANVATATSLGFRAAGKSWFPQWLKTKGFIK